MSFAVRMPKSSYLRRSASTASACQVAKVNHRVSYQPRRHLSASQQAAGTANDVPAAAAAKDQTNQKGTPSDKPQVKKKSMAELDEELRLKLEGISGDGGASGVEYENGKAQGLKRNVKANMFRVI